MPRRANFRIDSLMTRHASIRANVQIAHVAHAGRDAIRVGVIRPGMRANPILRRAMATFTRDAFRHGGIVPQPPGRHGGKRRMANGATRALSRVANLENFREPLRPRRFQRGIRPRMMKIVRGPDRILLALFARATMAAARAAALRTEKFGRRDSCGCFLGENSRRWNEQK